LFDENHPQVVCVLKTMAALYQHTGDEAQVAKLVQRIDEIPFDSQVVQASIVRNVE
jgi:hypothetical protein